MQFSYPVVPQTHHTKSHNQTKALKQLIEEQNKNKYKACLSKMGVKYNKICNKIHHEKQGNSLFRKNKTIKYII